jgi:spermidine/putrescine-binding protein
VAGDWSVIGRPAGRRARLPAETFLRAGEETDAMRGPGRERRRFVCSLVLALAGWATAAAGGPLDGVTLRVGTWGGPWRDIEKELLAPKIEAQGGRVEFVTGSPQQNLAKLIAARGGAPPFDVMEVTDGELPRMIEGGFTQPIDLGAVPNLKDLPAGEADAIKVAAWTTQEGICYNTQKFAELGIAPPRTYKDLIHPKLEGRVQFPDIESGGGLAALAGIAYATGGDATNVEPSLDVVRQLKALRFWKSGTEAVTQLKSGDVYVAVLHAGWCIRAKDAGLPVASVHPVINERTRGVVKQGFIVVIKGSTQPKAAAAWVNAFLDPAFQAEFARKRGVVPANLKAVATLSQDPVLRDMLILDPAAIARMLRIDYGKIDVNAWVDKWNRAVTRR